MCQVVGLRWFCARYFVRALAHKLDGIGLLWHYARCFGGLNLFYFKRRIL